MVSNHPRFVRTNSQSVARVKATWRKPRGIDSKQRQKFVYAGAVPKIGYQGEKAKRNLRRDGSREVLVHNVAELQKLKSEKDVVARIAGTVGMFKRLSIYKEAGKLNLKVLN